MSICFPVKWRGRDGKSHARHMEKHSREDNAKFALNLIREYEAVKQADAEHWEKTKWTGLDYRQNANSDALRRSVDTCLEIMADRYGEEAVAGLQLALDRVERPGPELFCADCGDRYTEDELEGCEELGETVFIYREDSFFLCPDCYDRLRRLPLEDQIPRLLELKGRVTL